MPAVRPPIAPGDNPFGAGDAGDAGEEVEVGGVGCIDADELLGVDVMVTLVVEESAPL